MEKEPGQIDNSFEEIRSFQELFDFINSQRLSGEYKNAYEEAAHIAKGFVKNKNKSSWDSAVFEADFRDRYQKTTSQSYIDVLKRCIESYNPPVNIPSEPLWE